MTIKAIIHERLSNEGNLIPTKRFNFINLYNFLSNYLHYIYGTFLLITKYHLLYTREINYFLFIINYHFVIDRGDNYPFLPNRILLCTVYIREIIAQKIVKINEIKSF
jgi:hypothetical protein